MRVCTVFLTACSTAHAVGVDPRARWSAKLRSARAVDAGRAAPRPEPSRPAAASSAYAAPQRNGRAEAAGPLRAVATADLPATEEYTFSKAFQGPEYGERIADLYQEGVETLERRKSIERRLDAFFAERDAVASLWPTIRREAAEAASPVLKPFLDRAVAAHASLPAAAATLLADRLAAGGVDAAALAEVLAPRLARAEATLARDLMKVVETDPAAPGLLAVFLHFKGFHALAAHRAASALWAERSDPGAAQLALLLQGRASAEFGVDIHPGATMGAGVFVDHASGVVIGEQASVGDDCYILHGVTLGATGKVKNGRRHPTVGAGCTIGSGASVLGPITVGDGCTIAAGATVTKDVEAGATVIDTGFMNNRVLLPKKRRY